MTIKTKFFLYCTIPLLFNGVAFAKTLRWSPVDGAMCYRVYRNVPGQGWKAVAQTLGTETHSQIKGTGRYAVSAVGGGDVEGKLSKPIRVR